ncbi:hypothetical protein B0T20DRAFT_479200 [Sordaria brevicollis]|uniref:Uncharacterized protein n=1 Tax=Sordaria brevicollis TaxID=83679 RepID=A0AAE0PEE3_SORBR|nr:hypothetical protein B0T20DRAFT_479200 [Sordaria brevicollis]
MAKILLAEHRERRERPGTASSGESRSRPYSPMSSLSPSSTESSFRAGDCFSPIRERSVRSEDNSKDQQHVQSTTSDSTRSEFDDQWYAEWFSQWILESSRKLRSPESESRFSSYSPLSSRAQSPAVSVTGSNGDDIYIRTRPSTPTPLSSPTFGPRGRRRDRCLSISSFSGGSLPSPTRHDHGGSYSPVYRSPSRRRRSPSPLWRDLSPRPSRPVYRRRTPSPLNIGQFPLPPSTLSSIFPTATSTSSSSRPSSRASSRPSAPYGASSPTSRPSSPAQIQTEFEYQPEPRIRPGPRPTSAAETEDYLPNAHLLRFPASVSARLMMTAETLGVDEVGKMRLASQLQRTPTAGSTATASETVLESGVEVKNWRRKSEEVKGSGFDWGYGMEKDEEGGEEERGYGTD